MNEFTKTILFASLTPSSMRWICTIRLTVPPALLTLADEIIE